MRVRVIPFASLVLGGAILADGAAGQSLSTVSVTVKIVAEDYELRFRPNVADVEAAAARLFVEFLNPKVGFLAFAANADTLSHRLSFRLNRRDTTSTGAFAEVGFWVELSGADGTLASLYWRKVRGGEQATAGIGTAEAFLAQLKTDILPHADAGPLREVLSEVPITTDGLMHPNPLGWALRFRSADLCIRVRDDDVNLFKISSELQGPIIVRRLFEARITGEFTMSSSPSPEQQQYVGGIFMEPTPASLVELNNSMTIGPVLVKRVFLVSYHHDTNACRVRDLGPG